MLLGTQQESEWDISKGSYGDGPVSSQRAQNMTRASEQTSDTPSGRWGTASIRNNV